jgi:hypothetical protein
MLPKAPKRSRATVLLQIEDPKLDLSGDSGAIGRLTMLGRSGIVLDLKGHQYTGRVVPCTSFMVVSFSAGGKEAKVESLVSDFVQMEHLADIVGEDGDGGIGGAGPGEESALLRFHDVDAPEAEAALRRLKARGAEGGGDEEGGDDDEAELSGGAGAGGSGSRSDSASASGSGGEERRAPRPRASKVKAKQARASGSDGDGDEDEDDDDGGGGGEDDDDDDDDGDDDDDDDYDEGKAKKRKTAAAAVAKAKGKGKAKGAKASAAPKMFGAVVKMCVRSRAQRVCRARVLARARSQLLVASVAGLTRCSAAVCTSPLSSLTSCSKKGGKKKKKKAKKPKKA